MRLVNAILASGLIVSVLDVRSGRVCSGRRRRPRRKPLTGLWLTTDYPALTERLGNDVRLDLTLPTRTCRRAGSPSPSTGCPTAGPTRSTAAARPSPRPWSTPDASRTLTLKITPPKDAKSGTYDFTVNGKTDSQTLDLPVDAGRSPSAKPATVTARAEAAGAPRHRRSRTSTSTSTSTTTAPADQTFNLLAKAPAGFDATFKEQYGIAGTDQHSDQGRRDQDR